LRCGGLPPDGGSLWYLTCTAARRLGTFVPGPAGLLSAIMESRPRGLAHTYQVMEGCVAGDEQIRAQVMRPREILELTRAESWRLLRSVSLGRIVFSWHAMPAIRPVNHLVEDETIIVRSHLGSAIVSHASADDSVVVCYEADELDPVRHTGWSVIATGTARLVRDPAAISRYEQLLEPWAAGQMDHVIAVKPQIITGIRLVS
jgi:nitroimidazol reductase NimA-like FMN-containing flavoprotein (pyridoxamine 5'-phosphate oxidase superfamily)